MCKSGKYQIYLRNNRRWKAGISRAKNPKFKHSGKYPEIFKNNTHNLRNIQYSVQKLQTLSPNIQFPIQNYKSNASNYQNVQFPGQKSQI